MKISRYFQFFLGILAGFFISSMLFVINGEYGARMISSVFQIETGGKSADSSQNSSSGLAGHGDVVDNISAGRIVGRSTEHILVKFKSNIGQERKNQILAERGARENGNIAQINLKFITIPPGKSPEEFVSDMKTKHAEDIEFAEVDSLISPSYIPNDPYYANQWHHQKIQSPIAWDTNQGSGITIAILDTGTDCTHPDLQASCIPGWNANDNNTDTTDINGHGTIVAGTAAAIGNNNAGVIGMAYKAKIMPVRITSDPTGYAYFSTMASAITWATDHGAKVANLSFGGVNGSSAIISAATYMRSKGGILVVAEGNSGVDSTYANTNDMISVSATDTADNRTSWSTYGADTDISAPGAGIYSTSRGGGYVAANGTSFSSPLTAGVVALIFSVNPKLTPDQAQNILFTSADDLGAAGWDMYYGWGRINAAKATAAALTTIGTRDIIAPSIPMNLVATAKTSTSIGLTWNASTDIVGVTGYNIYRNNVKIGTTTTQSYTDVSGLSASTAYSYTVSAYDADGNTSAMSNVASATTLDISLSITSNLVTTTTSSANISWSTSMASSGQVIYGASASALTSSLISSQVGVISDALTITGLRNKTTYYYQVIVTDSTGKSVSTPLSKFITKNR